MYCTIPTLRAGFDGETCHTLVSRGHHLAKRDKQNQLRSHIPQK